MTTKKSKINRSDLKFYPSERLSDNDDGGGLAMGAPIVGNANEIFNPISTIDRVNGAFNMRKIFAGLQRADDEPLIGAHVAITRSPDDDAISYLLSKSRKFGEMRDEAVKYVENFNIAGIQSEWILMNNPPIGSKVIQAYGTKEAQALAIGQVLCLRQEKEGYAKHEQYVQITKIEESLRTFFDAQKNSFTCIVCKIEISQPLAYEFIGAEYPTQHQPNPPTKIRETHVVDAANYYGIKPLAVDAKQGDGTIKLTDVMEKIAPVGIKEIPLHEQKTQKPRAINKPIGKAQSFYVNHWHDEIHLGNSVIADSLTLQTNTGKLTAKADKIYQNEHEVGTLDVQNGIIKLANAPLVYDVNFMVGASLSVAQDSTMLMIDNANRGFSHIVYLGKQVSLGSLSLVYRAMGRHYTLKDDGTGKLVGNNNRVGNAIYNKNTGEITVSCGEMPDVGSAIVIAWASDAIVFDRSDVVPSVNFAISLEHEYYDNMQITWQQDGESKSAKAQKDDDNITGDAKGSFDQKNKKLLLNPWQTNGHLEASISYHHAQKIEKSFSYENIGEVFYYRQKDKIIVNQFHQKKIVRGSFTLTCFVEIQQYEKHKATIKDDGLGNLIDLYGNTVGSIDYASASFSMDDALTVHTSLPNYEIHQKNGQEQKRLTGFEYRKIKAKVHIGSSYELKIYFDDNTSNKAIYHQQAKLGDLTIDLLPDYDEQIIEKSLRMTLGAMTITDASGVLYKQDESKKSIGTPIGQINYQTGIATIFAGAYDDLTLTVKALASYTSNNPITEAAFIAQSAPIRPQSLAVRATSLDGKEIVAQSDKTGNITGDGIKGKIDYEYGNVSLKFGRFIDAKWQDTPVLADSITYSAIATSFLPLNASHIKIDTVRLPIDGRVPIFRRGDTIIIGSRKTEIIGSAFKSEQTVELNRQNLDRICLMDDKDKPVLANLWHYDLQAGTITFNDPLDLSGYQMPLKVMHAKEEKNRVMDVDIDGTLSLMFALRHDYKAFDTDVSSVLIGGDLQVRASVPFTQRHWNNQWQDSPIGEQLLNRLNVKDYPIQLTDDGAISERWLIKWTSANNFELYGETLGFVAKTDTLQNLAPINPATNKPYFTIDKRAFGTDATWASQDVIRFNTWGTLMPIWIIKAVQPTGHKPSGKDAFNLCLFGDTTEDE